MTPEFNKEPVEWLFATKLNNTDESGIVTFEQEPKIICFIYDKATANDIIAHRKKALAVPPQVVTDEEIEQAWDLTFVTPTTVTKRRIIYDTCKDYATACSSGKISTHICIELGLLEQAHHEDKAILTQKGLNYIIHYAKTNP